MASNLSSIGLPVQNSKELIGILSKAAEYSENIDCEYGQYQKWASKTGAELWQHINKTGQFRGFTLFYNGESNFTAGITEKIYKENYNDLEALLYAWANPDKDDPSMGDFPFAFDCVNFSAVEKMEFPCIKNIKLSAFARELAIYPSEADYFAQQKGEVQFASKSFIPSGALSPDFDLDSGAGRPDEIFPEAIFSGIVLDYKELNNELSGENYYWIKTETCYGIIIDVVADPNLVKNNLKINGVVSGGFYLCGKIVT